MLSYKWLSRLRIKGIRASLITLADKDKYYLCPLLLIFLYFKTIKCYVFDEDNTIQKTGCEKNLNERRQNEHPKTINQES